MWPAQPLVGTVRPYAGHCTGAKGLGVPGRNAHPSTGSWGSDISRPMALPVPSTDLAREPKWVQPEARHRISCSSSKVSGRLGRGGLSSFLLHLCHNFYFGPIALGFLNTLVLETVLVIPGVVQDTHSVSSLHLSRHRSTPELWFDVEGQMSVTPQGAERCREAQCSVACGLCSLLPEPRCRGLRQGPTPGILPLNMRSCERLSCPGSQAGQQAGLRQRARS